jgi:hypothetical protein
VIAIDHGGIGVTTAYLLARGFRVSQTPPLWPISNQETAQGSKRRLPPCAPSLPES